MKVRFYSVEKYVDRNSILKVDREEYVELRGEYTCDEAQAICDEYNEKYSGRMEYEVVVERKSFQCNGVKVSSNGNQSYKVNDHGTVFVYETLKDLIVDFANIANNHSEYVKFMQKVWNSFGVWIGDFGYIQNMKVTG